MTRASGIGFDVVNGILFDSAAFRLLAGTLLLVIEEPDDIGIGMR
jgi:hypothetical protein